MRPLGSRRPTLFLAAIAFVASAATTALAQVADEPTDGPGVGFQSPELRYSTTVGGGVAEGRALVLDSNGNTIIAGNTLEKFDFALVNAADTDPGDEGEEGFVIKINAAGDNVVFSTYLGGEGDDWITDVDVDSSGNIYVSGITAADDFPTTGGSLQPDLGHDTGGFGTHYDGFVTKLDPSGNIVWSTYLGGDRTDEAHGLRVGDDGSVYVVGSTGSFDFPSTNGAYQEDCSEQFNLCGDAFLVRIAANGGSLVFGSFLGGQPQGEVACSVDVDASGNVFVVGQYVTDGFPYVDPFQGSHDAGTDWFVTKFAADGDDLLWSSGLGGNSQEATCNRFQIGASIVLDSAGDVFVGGLTASTNFTASGTYQTSFGGTTDGYLAKITSAGMFEWGSYIGGDRNESIRDIAVLNDGSPVIVGASDSLNFPQTSDALEQSYCPSQQVSCSPDAYAAILSSDGSTLEFSTQLGGSDNDEATDVAVAADGSIYIGGVTRTELWPLVNPLPEPLQGSGGTLAFVAQIGGDTTRIPGDVNGDGSVTATDALAGLQVALGTGQCLLCVCDLNGDGSITASDALIILNIAVGFTPVINPPEC